MVIEISENNQNSSAFYGYVNESFESLIKRLKNSQIIRHINNIQSEMKETGILEERKKILIDRLGYCQNILKLRNFVEEDL